MTNAEPLVTVAMPLYNAAGSLEKALSLIRAQTYRNLDIILCDNASTDATPDICAAAARDDARIRYFRQPRNLGPVANFNFGLTVKRGEYFMWAAHDDEKMPEFVADTVATLQGNPKAVMACTWTVLITGDGEILHKPYSPPIRSDTIEERVPAFVADTQCVAFYGLFRSSVLDRLGPTEDWLDTDRHYLFRAILEGPFEVVPKALFRFKWHHGADYYSATGFRMRPGATDYDLDLYHYFPQLMREAGIDAEVVRRSTAAMRDTLRAYFENRANYLISRALGEHATRRERLRSLYRWARQYPPLFRRRIFWGAVRRVALGS